MERKNGIFILGALSGVVIAIFLVLLSVFVYRPTNDSTWDVFKQIDASIHSASPNVVGIVNIQSGKERGTGSGVIYKLTETEAYVVTNYHVVKQADEIEVAFKDERREKARVIGEDMLTDLAVIAIPKGELTTTMKFADDNELSTGEFVFAIGNPLGLDLYGSITSGIVSSNYRLIPVDIDKNGEDDFIATVIQTDAAINPGNSGGALINISGELVGINSMKIAGTQIEGIGFSIPINIVRHVIADLENYQMVIRPYLGLHLRSMSHISKEDKEKWQLDTIEQGVYVNDVSFNSSSYEAGIKVNDVITHVEGEKVRNVTDMRFKLYNYQVGDAIELTVIRGSEEMPIHITLKSRLAYRTDKEDV